MSILNTTEEVRKTAKAFGQYRFVAEQSGAGYEWLSKFANGAIPNPTVANVALVEAFFKRQSANASQDQQRS